MKRFLPVMFALSFSAIAIAVLLFVFRPRMESVRVATGELRHKVEEVIEEIADREEEADR
jgi:hypothetical protein